MTPRSKAENYAVLNALTVFQWFALSLDRLAVNPPLYLPSLNMFSADDRDRVRNLALAAAAARLP